MLEHEQALSLIIRNARPLGTVPVPLRQAPGLVLARTVKAGLAFPHFDNSAVDGFAICPENRDQREFKFKGEIPAGSAARRRLKPGEALAVFTGAPVPAGTRAVVMQEFAERRNGSVCLREAAGEGENIRRQGEDFRKDDVLIPKGTVLAPSHIALLAALGKRAVPVFRRPSVAFLSTGSEITAPGKKLKRGQIYDSNTPLVEALAAATGAIPAPLEKVSDSSGAIRRAVRAGLRHDVLVLCGGVSVGKYDFVKEALRREGVREIFWKINIKPGKPVFFGRKGKTLVFGLPGNPVSVYVTFEEFVRPALLKMMGRKYTPSLTEGFLKGSFRNGARPHFIRVRCRAENGRWAVSPLKGQGSHQIGTLAKANGILRAAAGETFKNGQRVLVKMIGGEAT